MRIVKKNVYYCDFCKKHSLRPLMLHEKHCTANPDRHCRMCEGRVSIKDMIEKYKSMVIKECQLNEYTGHTWETISMSASFKMEDLQDEAEGCPACILTVVRCVGIPPTFEWSYKEAVAEWWANRNEEARNEDEYEAMYL